MRRIMVLILLAVFILGTALGNVYAGQDKPCDKKGHRDTVKQQEYKKAGHQDKACMKKDHPWEVPE